MSAAGGAPQLTVDKLDGEELHQYNAALNFLRNNYVQVFAGSDVFGGGHDERTLNQMWFDPPDYALYQPKTPNWLFEQSMREIIEQSSNNGIQKRAEIMCVHLPSYLLIMGFIIVIIILR